ncbi:aminoacyl-tRNA hydrolase [Buchnera aphidicola]|uniref:Peptidyl-tRNA hydrolase n=1 Tax=Buchnera aphidicola subsp. Rhopalosiphum maidis TaxID=118109 RepID=A0A3G2I6B9_BUCRM|nr:aminoacyl-tRNA hydrolase [Buchnera aphidicola]AYN24855.1 aminoacyl-tRNA hydrolase [Buchnera aphidicola (Rhopalosiphum maidis)]
MIVGLSNPKKKYHKTRHNVGSWYIYTLAKYYCSVLKEEKKFFGFTTCLNIKSNLIYLLVPNIFMNINGYSVHKMASFYKISLSQILIVHDDLDLDPGIIKYKYSYGHSGHNGLRNIIKEFNTQVNFCRLRVGIGRPKNKNEISSFVLSIPDFRELNLIQKSISYAIKENFTLLNFIQ